MAADRPKNPSKSPPEQYVIITYCQWFFSLSCTFPYFASSEIRFDHRIRIIQLPQTSWQPECFPFVNGICGRTAEEQLILEQFLMSLFIVHIITCVRLESTIHICINRSLFLLGMHYSHLLQTNLLAHVEFNKSIGRVSRERSNIWMLVGHESRPCRILDFWR